MFKTFEYRLYPNRRQREALLKCLVESRRLYNEMLEIVKEHHEETGSFLFKYALSSRFRGCSGEHVPASTVQTLADRLNKALKRYLLRKKLDKKAGFPRFKAANRWHSIHLRQYGKSRDVRIESGRLRVPSKLGKSIKIKQHRPLEGMPKTAHLVLRADGKWYVLVVCDLGETSTDTDKSAAIGLDIGLKAFIVDSDGGMIENPRCYRRSQKKLQRKQKALCRRKKGSNRRKRAARSVAKTHLKVARQRKDFLHKTEYKAESAGARVVEVPARFTTQTCSNCEELVPKALGIRTHVCDCCGYIEDRDVNAAKNILKAGMRPSERNVKGCLERAPSSPLL